MTYRRRLHAEERLQIAAAQQWACATCSALLPPAFEIDHIVELADGGDDEPHNMQALCGTCHAVKTQQARIARYRRTRSDAASITELYDNRNDVVVAPGIFECELCRKRRPMKQPHAVCWALEARVQRGKVASATKLQNALDRFKFQSRLATTAATNTTRREQRSE